MKAYMVAIGLALAFGLGYVAPRGLTESRNYRHWDLCVAHTLQGKDETVCFDRTDGHGNKVAFTRTDQLIVEYQFREPRIDATAVK